VHTIYQKYVQGVQTGARVRIALRLRITAPDPGRRFNVDSTTSPPAVKPLVVPEIVTLPDEIDISNAHRVSDEVRAALRPGVAVAIADMTGTVFCDSTGVRHLLLAAEHAAAAGAELRLAIESAAVLRVLQVTGVDQLLMIYPGMQAALTGGQTSSPRVLQPRERSAE
jgi:anti-sigma B factor antagonist